MIRQVDHTTGCVVRQSEVYTEMQALTDIESASSLKPRHADQWLEVWSSEDHGVWVFETPEGELCGFLVGMWSDGVEAGILDIVVRPHWRRMGVARTLVHSFVHDMAECEHTDVMACVDERRTDLALFLQACGMFCNGIDAGLYDFSITGRI